jgi:hypothetical protein
MKMRVSLLNSSTPSAMNRMGRIAERRNQRHEGEEGSERLLHPALQAHVDADEEPGGRGEEDGDADPAQARPRVAEEHVVAGARVGLEDQWPHRVPHSRERWQQLVVGVDIEPQVRGPQVDGREQDERQQAERPSQQRVTLLT